MASVVHRVTILEWPRPSSLVVDQNDRARRRRFKLPRMGERSSTEPTRIKQHGVPRHVLARFENDGGGLTVVRRTPEMKVLREIWPVKLAG